MREPPTKPPSACSLEQLGLACERDRSGKRPPRLAPESVEMRAAPLLALVLALAAPEVATPQAWSPPRTPDGAADLQGVWSNASVTRLTRPAGVSRLEVGDAEAEQLAKSSGYVRYLDADAAPSDPNKGALATSDDPGGYNGFWIDPGRTLAKVGGTWRTSWIVDPTDGQLPLSAKGRDLVARAEAFARAADAPTDPEALEPWDRCLISSRGSGGPGMLNNIYNSNMQIVQSRDAVVIVVEMVHDARVIPMFPDKAAAQAAHRPAALQPWLGDSVGWWEDEALVVESTHVNREQGRAGPIYLTPEGRVTERFRRVGPGEIAYGFTVEDPTYYSRPWRAEMSLRSGPTRLYEYACHEGNYALPGILRGARAETR